MSMADGQAAYAALRDVTQVHAGMAPRPESMKAMGRSVEA